MDEEDDDIDESSMRGIVPVPIRYKHRYSGTISFKPGECPRWKPLMTGDYGRRLHDDEDEQEVKEI